MNIYPKKYDKVKMWIKPILDEIDHKLESLGFQDLFKS